MGQLPCNAVRSHLDLVDLHPAGATIGIHAAEPEVVFASPINQPLKARSQVFDLATHALSVSIRCIERRIWVGTATALVRCAKSESVDAFIWTFECAPRDLNPEPAD